MFHYKSAKLIHLNLAFLCGSAPQLGSQASQISPRCKVPCCIWHSSRKNVTLDNWEVVCEAQIRASAVAKRKNWEGADFVQTLLWKQVPDPSPPYWVTESWHRVVTWSTEAFFSRSASASRVGSSEVWFWVLAPIPAGCLTSGKSLTLWIIPALQLRLTRDLTHFNYINSKHIFTRYMHASCHKKKSF